MVHTITRTIGGKEISIESGLLGKQASGSVVCSCGGSKVFAAVTINPETKPDQDFFPLTVDYREMTYASGKIPGSFFRREGKQTERETLVSRLIDRPLRPQFPDAFTNEVAIQALAISFDGVNETDILAQIAANAALAISEAPATRIIGSARVALIDGQYVFNPLIEQISTSQLDIVVSGSREGVCMVEAGMNELSEDIVLGAIEFAHKAIVEVVAMIEELVALCGKPKMTVVSPQAPAFKSSLRDKYEPLIMAASGIHDKLERRAALAAVRTSALAEFPALYGQEIDPAELAKAYADVEHHAQRKMSMIARCDGRRFDEIRPISIIMSYLPNAHGSSIFTRGETQSLSTCTLGTFSDELLIDGIHETYYDQFMLHYNFPSFAVGETWPNRGPKRREIGHGALAKRALRSVLPKKEDFPYVIRLVSDILESNGSSSMATVCGGSLAMMDAGVPIKTSVAGIAMGLIKEGEEYVILTDILGDEDHFGDMDFKVAGTRSGITALQMDIKITGISTKIMADALEHARKGRLFILDRMEEVMPAPRPNLSPNAPRIHQLKIPVDLIGKLIGPGGKTVRRIQEITKAKVEISDDGSVLIAAVGEEQLRCALDMVKDITLVPTAGELYDGVIIDVRDFGVIVKLGAEAEGMCHISEFSPAGYVRDIAPLAKVGDPIKVKVLSVGDDGKVRLSRKAALLDAGETDPLEELIRTLNDRPQEPRRDDRPRSNFGGRGGDRGRDRGHDRRR